MSRPTLALLCLAALASVQDALAEVHIFDFTKTPAAGQLSLSEIPERPADRIVDEAGRLSAEVRGRAEEALGAARSAPTYLVILDGDLPAPPEVYGNELLRRWVTGGGRLGALVLAVPSPLPATHVMIAGKALDQEDIAQLRQLATAALALAGEDQSQADGAARSATSLLSALETFAELYNESIASPKTPPGMGTETDPKGSGATSIIASESYIPTETSRWDRLAAELDWGKVRTVAAIVGGLLLLVSSAILLPRIFRNRRLIFPECEPRQRFSAPFSGGSNAQIKFRR